MSVLSITPSIILPDRTHSEARASLEPRPCSFMLSLAIGSAGTRAARAQLVAHRSGLEGAVPGPGSTFIMLLRTCADLSGLQPFGWETADRPSCLGSAKSHDRLGVRKRELDCLVAPRRKVVSGSDQRGSCEPAVGDRRCPGMIMSLRWSLVREDFPGQLPSSFMSCVAAPKKILTPCKLQLPRSSRPRSRAGPLGKQLPFEVSPFSSHTMPRTRAKSSGILIGCNNRRKGLDSVASVATLPG